MCRTSLLIDWAAWLVSLYFYSFSILVFSFSFRYPTDLNKLCKIYNLLSMIFGHYWLLFQFKIKIQVQIFRHLPYRLFRKTRNIIWIYWNQAIKIFPKIENLRRFYFKHWFWYCSRKRHKWIYKTYYGQNQITKIAITHITFYMATWALIF
jgi:hypothetical protein